MTNREKYRDRIIDIALRGDTLAVKGGKPYGCMEIECEDCDLLRDCEIGTGEKTMPLATAWAESEAEE